MNKQGFKYTLNIILTLSGLFWILLFFYRYFIYIRVFKSITLLGNIYLVMLFSIISAIQAITILKTILLMNKESSFITDISNFIYWNPLLFVYENLFERIPSIGSILIFLCKCYRKCYKYLNKNFFLIYYIFTEELPKMMLLIAFVADIFIFEYFYYTRLLIPVFMPILIINKVLLFILKDFCEKNLEELGYMIDITFKENHQHIIKLKPEYYHRSNDLHLFATNYFIFYPTLYVIKQITQLRTTFSDPTKDFVILTIYFAGFCKLLLVCFHLYLSLFLYISSIILLILLKKYLPQKYNDKH